MEKYDEALATAVAMANESGLINLSRKGLCDRMGIPDGSFPYLVGCSFTELLTTVKERTPGIKTGSTLKKRVDPELRRESILESAVALAETGHFAKVLIKDIAEHAGVSMGLVMNYFSTIAQLRRAVMRYAIQHENLVILAQGIAHRDEHALKAPYELRQKAIAALSEV